MATVSILKQSKNYNNNFSFMFGVLCLGVVYLHSSWAGGFDIQTLGLEGKVIKQGLGLLNMSIVPSFFILWGYLSRKYFYSEEKALPFFKKKIIQFYPVYLTSFFINVLTRFDYISALPKWKVILALFGMYYESGLWGGGHIFLVVLTVITTISIFKIFKLGSNAIFIFSIACLFITKFLPHDESSLCYIQYFGYYTAFFLGVLLNHFSALDVGSRRKSLIDRIIVWIIFSVGILTPLLNLFKIYILEVEYNPNSPEQLFFCAFMLYIFNRVIDKYSYIRDDFFLSGIIHKIGNNAYWHFMFQSHLIRLIIYLNMFLVLDKLLLQILIISFTSIIVVYLLLPVYRSVTSVLMIKLTLFPV